MTEPHRVQKNHVDSDMRSHSGEHPLAVTDPAGRTSIIATSIRGASHARSGKPCQDAYRAISGSGPNGPWAAVAVADGHGAAIHDLSDVGSQQACKAACHILETVPLEDGTEEHESLWLGSQGIAEQIYEEWLRGCEAHHKAASEQHTDSEGNASFDATRYGTTLLAGFVQRDRVNLMRIGDGDIVMQKGGGEIGLVFHEDATLASDETHSLCSEDPLKHIELRQLWRDDLEALYFSTDGLKNSYADDDAFCRFLASIKDQVREFGTGPVANALLPALENATTNGSGDDITLLTLLFERAATEADEDNDDAETGGASGK